MLRTHEGATVRDAMGEGARCCVGNAWSVESVAQTQARDCPKRIQIVICSEHVKRAFRGHYRFVTRRVRLRPTSRRNSVSIKQTLGDVFDEPPETCLSFAATIEFAQLKKNFATTYLGDPSLNPIELMLDRIQRDPELPSSRVLSDLLIALDSGEPFHFKQLYRALDYKDFTLALEAMRAWRLEERRVARGELSGALTSPESCLSSWMTLRRRDFGLA